MSEKPYESLQEIAEHENSDYPVGVYYVEPSGMFMEHVRWHWHSEIEIDLIKSGSAVYQFGENTVTLTEGQAIFINQNIIHSIRETGKEHCVIVSLIFSPGFLFPSGDSAISNAYLTPIVTNPKRKYRIFSPEERFGRGVITYLEDIFYTNLQKEFGFELKTKSLLCQLWLLFLTKTPGETKQPEKNETSRAVMTADEIRIKDAIYFIKQNYADPISLEDIAGSIHVSKSECCRCFHRAVNMTPFEYLMHYRVLKAADTIQKNPGERIPISELATSVGFNNTSYFNKRFREYFGCTPTEFRKQAKTEHRDKLGTFGLSLTHI